MKDPASTKSNSVWQRKEIDSPCIKICVIHPTEKICAGCYRYLEEISRWADMNREERTKIMAELPIREGKLARRRGGRRLKLRKRLNDLNSI